MGPRGLAESRKLHCRPYRSVVLVSMCENPRKMQVFRTKIDHTLRSSGVRGWSRRDRTHASARTDLQLYSRSNGNILIDVLASPGINQVSHQALKLE